MVNPIQSVDLDTTIAALQQDPTKISSNKAFAIIEAWQQKLEGDDIAEDLGELKEAIQSRDTAAISRILTDLGEDTTGVATDLPTDVAAKVQQLGSLLKQAGSRAK
ncbi:MAG: hypothetical protein PUP90_09545 [Nostoc sp. S4]|nr:hypothetical protein [Nostoc sp. S4]